MTVQKWSAIKSKMSPERVARVDADVVAKLAEMTQAELSKMKEEDESHQG